MLAGLQKCPECHAPQYTSQREANHFSWCSEPLVDASAPKRMTSHEALRKTLDDIDEMASWQSSTFARMVRERIAKTFAAALGEDDRGDGGAA